MVDHQGMVGGGGAKRFLFLAKAEEILRYIHEIADDFSWEDRKILDKASEIISSRISEMMEDQKGVLDNVRIKPFSEEAPLNPPK